VQWQICNPNYQPVGQPMELEDAVAKTLKLIMEKDFDRTAYSAGVEPRDWEGSKTPVKVGLYRRGLMGGRIGSHYTIFPIKS